MKQNTTKNFVIIASLILVLFTFIKSPTMSNTELMDDRWFTCMNNIDEGKLYDYQANCSQGPVLFYSLYMFYKFSYTHLHEVLTFFAILISTGILVLMRKIIEKETKTKPFLGLITIYSIAFYFPFLSHNYGIFLSTFLFLTAFYILYYTKIKYKESIAALFFFLSVFTKASGIIPSTLIIGYYLYTTYKTNYKQLAISGTKITAVIATLTALLMLKYPLVLVYTIFGHTYAIYTSYSYAIFTFFASLTYKYALTYEYFIIAWIIIISFYYLAKKRSVFFLVSSIGLLLSFIKLKQAHDPGSAPTIYFTICLLFFVMGMYTILTKKPTIQKKLAVVIIIILLIPFMMNMFTTNKIERINSIISKAGMQSLSEMEGTLIIEKNTDKKELEGPLPHLNVDNKEIIRINPLLYPWDVYFSQPFALKKGLNIEETFHRNVTNDDVVKLLTDREALKKYQKVNTEDKLFEIIKTIKDEEFNLIIMHEPFSNNLKIVTDLIEEKDGKTFCTITVPGKDTLTTKGKYRQKFIFKDKEACEKTRKEIQEHYNKNIENICKMSEEAASIIRTILKNDIHVPNCKDKGNFKIDTHIKFLSGRTTEEKTERSRVHLDLVKDLTNPEKT
jgi:hypothetical protein